MGGLKGDKIGTTSITTFSETITTFLGNNNGEKKEGIQMVNFMWRHLTIIVTY